MCCKIPSGQHCRLEPPEQAWRPEPSRPRSRAEASWAANRGMAPLKIGSQHDHAICAHAAFLATTKVSFPVCTGFNAWAASGGSCPVRRLLSIFASLPAQLETRDTRVCSVAVLDSISQAPRSRDHCLGHITAPGAGSSGTGIPNSHIGQPYLTRNCRGGSPLCLARLLS